MSVPVPAVVPSVVMPAPAEPGWRSTEFYVTLATSALSVLTLFHVVSLTNDQVQTILGLVGLLGSQVAYAIGRSLRKSGTPG